MRCPILAAHYLARYLCRLRGEQGRGGWRWCCCCCYCCCCCCDCCCFCCDCCCFCCCRGGGWVSRRSKEHGRPLQLRGNFPNWILSAGGGESVASWASRPPGC